jgi:hypothetical protein
VQAGTIISQAWELYKRHWRHLIPIALAVYVLVALLTLLLTALLGWVGALLGFLVSIAGIFWLQGALVLAVDDVRDGRADLSIGETLNRVLPRLNTLTLAGLLAGLGIFLGFLLLIVPGLYLLTIWLLIVPAIMLEGHGVLSSFGRSRELVRDYGWSVFGVIVLTVVIMIGVGLAVSIVEAAVDNSLLTFLLDIATDTLTAPFLALAWTLTYFELRSIKEPEPDSVPAPASA